MKSIIQTNKTTPKSEAKRDKIISLIKEIIKEKKVIAEKEKAINKGISE